MSVSESRESANPFPGLRPFYESEQHLFFGRESQVDAMVDKLAANRFLAVVGTSGSGKSSLVNCGLRPALRTGLMANAGTRWRMAQCRPGGDPVAALSKALAADGVLFKNHQDTGMSLPDIVDTTLRMGKLGLVDIVEQAQLPLGTNLLLVIDQFEELFRYQHLSENGRDGRNEIRQAAVAFVNLLLAAIEQSALPVYVVITMRSDFLGDCAQYPGLAEAINSGQYLVPRMTREQRRAAIAGPIEVGRAKIYPPLLTRLVNDVGSNPDQLSILQHALNRTWSYWEIERSGQGMLDLECYNRIGNMTGALDQHADQAFSELETDEQRRICESLFKALTDKASDARGVRRPTRLNTLCEMCDASRADVVSVIDVFRQSSRSFLMPPEGVALHSDTVIDISHESLMRVWKKLDRWAEDEANSARSYQRLAQTSELYKQEDELLRDPDLRVALKWREQNKPNVVWARQYNPDFDGAMSFLKRSEKSDVMRKRLRGGAIAAVVLCLSGFVAFSSYGKFAKLSKQNDDLIVLKDDLIIEKEDLIVQKEDLMVQKEEAQVELDKAEQEAITALNEVVQVKSEVEDQVDISAQSIVVGAEAIKEAASALEMENERLQLEIDLLKGRVEITDANQMTDSDNSQSTAEEPLTVAEATRTRTRQGELQPDDIADQPIIIDTQQTHLTNFQACENVENLTPFDCKNENESFLPGKVFVFARVVTNIDSEKLTLRWFSNASSKSFDEKELTVQPNPEGYRTYTWKHLDKGDYRACLFEQSDRQIGCVSLTVGADDPVTRIESTLSAAPSIELDIQPSSTPVTRIGGNSNRTKKSLVTANTSSRSNNQQQNTEWKTTRLEDSEGDGFVVCKAVDKLQPEQCSDELEPGRVYAFARIVTPLNEETVTMRWFRDETEIPELQKNLVIKKNSSGFRTYSWNTFDSGSYAVSLSDKDGEELGKISFDVR